MRLYADGLFPKIHDASIEAMDVLRRPIVAAARGLTVELGVGSGLNLSHYSGATEVLGVEPAPGMLRRAVERASHARIPVRLVRGSAECLPFEDGSADTVLATFVLCTIPDPLAALREARRVLKPGGRLLFLEHVRDPEPRIARWQTRLTPIWRVLAVGCHLDRDAAGLVAAAGFELEEVACGPPPFWTPPILRAIARGSARRT